jgi:hypothetical protein
MSVTDAHHRYAPYRRKQNHRRLLALPLLVVAGVGTAAAGFILHVLWPGWQSAPYGPNAPAFPITVANVAFNVPPAAFRVPIQRQPGAHERVDLAFLWPSLQPPDNGPLPNVPTKGLPKRRTFERIFVTITVARDSLPPAERVKTIYPRYTESRPAAGAEGLAVLAFRQGTPYQGEDLVYEAAAPDKFLVRCTRNGNGPTPGMCLYARRLGEADVTVRFPRDWLEDWHTVADGIDRLIASLRPRE